MASIEDTRIDIALWAHDCSRNGRIIMTRVGNACAFCKGVEPVAVDAVKPDVVNHPAPHTSATLADARLTKQVEDLKKARWYIADEIKRLGGTP